VAGQIEAWIKERRGDAAVVLSSVSVQQLLDAAQDPAAQASVREYFRKLQQASRPKVRALSALTSAPSDFAHGSSKLPARAALGKVEMVHAEQDRPCAKFPPGFQARTHNPCLPWSASNTPRNQAIPLASQIGMCYQRVSAVTTRR
jgi:hypothetical protein